MRLYGVGRNAFDANMFVTEVVDEAVALAQLTRKRCFALDVVGEIDIREHRFGGGEIVVEKIK